MSYIDIVNLVAGIVTTVFTALAFHFIVFAIVGVFAKKTYPKTDKKLKYGIIIPARNEEAVVGNLIESIRLTNYPQDKLQIFVIAHNCSDKTADIAREMGATVYEYNNMNECTMGYAFRYLFDRIKEDWGIDNYDGFFLFNADNIVDTEYFDKMNDAFVAMGQTHTITSFRNSKNFGSNVISALYGLHFMYGCRFECRGRSVLGCSTRVQGTGYVISKDLVKDGWKYVTLTEDWEFSTDQIIDGKKIYYCDEAVFYDEQPTSFKIMWRQKVRWARGHFLVFFTRYKDIIKSLFKRKSKGGCPNKGSLHDMAINILPISLLTAVVTILQLGAYMFAPLFGIELPSLLLSWFITFLKAFGISCLTLMIPTVIIYIVERKRIKNLGFFTGLLALICWPLFLALYFPQEIVAILSKNLGWKEIPHKDKTKHSDLHKTEEKKEEAPIK